MKDQYVMSDPMPWRVMERPELIQRLMSIVETHEPDATGVHCQACLETYPCTSLIIATGGKECTS